MILTEIPRPTGRRRYKWAAVIEQFKDMNVPCVKLENLGIDPRGAYLNIMRTVRRHRFLNIRAFMLGGEVYIERTDMEG